VIPAFAYALKEACTSMLMVRHITYQHQMLGQQAHPADSTFEALDPVVTDAVDRQLWDARRCMPDARPPEKRDNGRPRMAALWSAGSTTNGGAVLALAERANLPPTVHTYRSDEAVSGKCAKEVRFVNSGVPHLEQGLAVHM
jgi:hypothetical protein